MKWIMICLLSFLLFSCSGDDNSSTNNSFLQNSKVLDANIWDYSVMCESPLHSRYL